MPPTARRRTAGTSRSGWSRHCVQRRRRIPGARVPGAPTPAERKQRTTPSRTYLPHPSRPAGPRAGDGDRHTTAVGLAARRRARVYGAIRRRRQPDAARRDLPDGARRGHCRGVGRRRPRAGGRRTTAPVSRRRCATRASPTDGIDPRTVPPTKPLQRLNRLRPGPARRTARPGRWRGRRRAVAGVRSRAGAAGAERRGSRQRRRGQAQPPFGRDGPGTRQEQHGAGGGPGDRGGEGRGEGGRCEARHGHAAGGEDRAVQGSRCRCRRSRRSLRPPGRGRRARGAFSRWSRSGTHRVRGPPPRCPWPKEPPMPGARTVRRPGLEPGHLGQITVAAEGVVEMGHHACRAKPRRTRPLPVDADLALSARARLDPPPTSGLRLRADERAGG